MSEIRKMIRKVNWYVKLIFNRVEDAKKNCKQYLREIESVEKEIQTYIEKTTNEFFIYANESTYLWFKNYNNIFLGLKKKISLSIVNHKLNKLSKNLKIARILKNNVEFIKIRLNQFDNIGLY